MLAPLPRKYKSRYTANFLAARRDEAYTSRSMTKDENLLGMGMVAINAAFVLQLAWIPSIFFLEGADWVTARMAVGVHRFALAYMIAAPLAYGVRRWLKGDRAEILTPWLTRLQIPLTLIAGVIFGFERTILHVTLPVIGGLMVAGVMIGLYGVALRREGVASV